MRVVLNFAITADGKIGTRAGGASKFTSRKDLERLWEIRKEADALMVGRGTLEADNMSMTIAAEAQPDRQPIRIIVSRTGGFSYDHPVFHTPGGDLHLLTTDISITSPAPEVTTHHMALPAFLRHCEEKLGIQTLLCEGGGELVRSIVELNAVTDIHLTLAGHTLIGGKLAPSILGKLSKYLPESQHFTLSHFQEIPEGELFLSYVKV